MNIRRISRIFLPLFLGWVLLAPARSYAFVPAAVYAAYAVAPSGASVALSAAGTGLTALVGTGLLYLSLSDGGTSQLRVPLGVDPVPAPTAPATTTAQTTMQYRVYIDWFNQTYTGSSFQAACSAVPWGDNNATYIGVNAAGTSCLYAYGTGCVAPNYCNKGVFSTAPVTNCPAGYTASGGSCALSDARQATPDNFCDISRNGTTLATIQDNDCAALNADVQAACSGSSCTIAGKDSSGNPIRIEINANPDGGTSTTVYTQRTSSGQSVIDTATIRTSGDGVVQQAASTTNAGSLPMDGAPVVGTPVTPSEVTFPTDYARQGEAAAAAAPAVQKLTNIETALTDSTVPDAATEPQSITDVMAQRDNVDEDITATGSAGLPFALPELSNPFQPMACQPLGFSTHGYSVTFDICPWVPTIKEILGYALYVLTAGMLFNMLMRRPDVSRG